MKVVQMSSSDMVDAIKSADPSRRNAVYKALYNNPMIRAKVQDWANMYSLHGKAPDDILQESIILLDELARSGRFRGDSRVETFLLGICKNMIRDSVKKVERVAYKENISEKAFDTPDDAAQAIELIELDDAEQRRDHALRRAMEQLTEKCREALRLYYFEQKSMAEVAAARALANAEQAKKAVFRCRESLRELIKGDASLRQLIAG